MNWLLLTDPGLEAFLADEVGDLAPGATARAGAVLSGRVRVAGELPWARLRLAQHAVEIVGEGQASTLDDARRVLSRVDVPELAAAASFRVTATGGGSLGAADRELAGAAGAVLQRGHGTRVNLDAPALVVRVDAHEGRLVAGVQRNAEPLGRRLRRGAALRGTLRATVAAALVRLVGAHRGAGSLLDPACGSGTIPVEAKEANPALDVFASDWDAPTVETARATFANHGVVAETRCCDARALGAAWGRRFGCVATNPPFGLRLGRRARLDEFYADLLRGFRDVLEEPGRIGLVTPRVKAVECAAARAGLRIEAAHPVVLGDLQPRLFLLT